MTENKNIKLTSVSKYDSLKSKTLNSNSVQIANQVVEARRNQNTGSSTTNSPNKSQNK